MDNLSLMIERVICDKIPEEELYELWSEYWGDTEEGNFVFPMKEIEIHLGVYSRTRIVRMLQSSHCRVADRWAYIEFILPYGKLSSSNYFCSCIDLEQLMEWVENGHRDICPNALWDIYQEYKGEN